MTKLRRYYSTRRSNVPRILLDQNAPYGLRNSLPGYEVKTAYQMGWADLSNSDLLREAEVARFAAMVTCDQNIR